MAKVESSLVISKRRRTVGLEHTSAIAPPARVSRRSAFSSTLRPVESMNITSVRSSTSAMRPAASDAASTPENSGAVLTWISPSTAMTVVRSSMSRSRVRNRGSAKDTARTTLSLPRPRVNRRVGARSSAEGDPAVHRGAPLLLVDGARGQPDLDRLAVRLAQQLDGLARQLQRPARDARGLARALEGEDRAPLGLDRLRRRLGEHERRGEGAA